MTTCEVNHVDYSPQGYVLRRCGRPAFALVTLANGPTWVCSDCDEVTVGLWRKAGMILEWRKL